MWSKISVSLLLFGALSFLTDSVTSESVKSWKFKLKSGDFIPMIGLGTSGFKGTELKTALNYALGAGYRHIDTAEFYGNEKDIGNALRELLPQHNLTRKDVFLTSKIDISDSNPDGYRSVKHSLENLGTDYIDLYLIHHPAIVLLDGSGELSKGPRNSEIRRKKWQDLIKAKKDGLIRNLGVSNYGVKHLKELLSNDFGVKPAVNQIHWNPARQPRDVLEFCQKQGILVEAYSSLGSRFGVELKDDPKVKQIAQKLGKTPVQVLLRWPLQKGIAIIPKSKSKKHLEENLDLDFVIPEEDMKSLDDFEQKPSWFEFDDID